MSNQPVQITPTATVAANDDLPNSPTPPSAPSARLLKGECIDTMSAMTAGSVDLVITSPPYLNIGMPYGDTFATIEDYIEFSRQWITAAARVLKPGGAMWINVGMHKAGSNSRVPLTYYLFPLIAGTGLNFVQEIVWDRRAHQRTTQRFSTRSERWLYLVKPGTLKGVRGRPKNVDPVFNLEDVRVPCQSADKRNNPAGANPSDIWDFTQVHGTSKERTAHPCPFPQAMIERIVLACSNPCDVVLDPFGGSGTTGAAAMVHGRSAVMIEREPTYWPIIEERLGLVDHHIVGKAKTGTDLFADFHHGDAIEKMKLIPSNSVNLILCDPPFGTTACAWDQLLPAAEMWREYQRILAPNGMIVLHAAQPFSIDLIMSNRPWFRQQLIWKKNRPVGFLHANRRHLVEHEEVLIFARPNAKMTFNPQGVVKKAAKVTRRGKVGSVYRDTYSKDEWVNDSSNYPRSVLEFDSDRDHGHPTQKPQKLAEYLISTYSNPGDVVLDHCFGSGTTGAAAMVTGRSFIGVERDPTWFEKGRARTLHAAQIECIAPPLKAAPANDVAYREPVQTKPEIRARQVSGVWPSSTHTEVISGDCLTQMRKMADGSVDLFMVSPPYNLGEGQGDFSAKGIWKSAKLRNGYAGHSDAMVAHLRGYLKDDEEVRATLQGWSRDMAKAVFAQMRQNMWRTTTTYRVTLNAAFSELKPQAFDGSGKDAVRDFRSPPERLNEIKRFIFTGFGPRACYAQAKFDSDTERKMAVLLERDPTVELWMKPGPNQFKIFDSEGSAYRPDFVVETKTERLIIETKRKSDMDDLEVRRKADAASLWCFIATEHHANKNGDKPWRYALVPDDAVQPNATLDGLLSQFVRTPDADLRGRYELSEGG